MKCSPNIVYIHSHDTGRYIEPYGHAIPTPHLKRLADGGVVFRDHHTAGPTCSPSRAALMTGQFPHQTGMLGLAHRGFSLHDYGKCIPHTLKKSGYASYLLGMQHIAHTDEQIKAIGYDVIDIAGPKNVATVAHRAAKLIASKPKAPFFIDAGFFETHRKGRDFERTDYKTDARYVRVPAPLPDNAVTRADMANFIDSARTYDDGVGIILDAIEKAGLAENTIIIATTDHGIAFPGMKCNLTSHGTGIMLIMRGPGVPSATVSDALSSNIDIYPTICELAGINAPPWLEGASLVPALSGKEVHEEIFSEVTYHAAYEPMRSVRTKEHLYIRRFKERNRPVLPNCDDSPSKDVWMEHGWPRSSLASEQLYDLISDPNETNDRCGDDAYAEIRAAMRARLEKYMKRTDDPLLAPSIPLPMGVIINDEDDLQPDATTAKKIS
ncbi:MAG: sulfatase [Spirochaetota bacterium]